MDIKNHLILFVGLFFVCQVKAQVLQLNVMNVELEGLTNYSISVNDTIKFSGLNNSTFYFNIKSNDVIRINQVDYEPYSFKISTSVKSFDTIRKWIQLKKVVFLDEITVSASNVGTIPMPKNDFILDYFLYPKDVLILLIKSRQTSYLKLKKDDATSSIDSVKLDQSYSELVRDALGNFFLVGDKTVQQFNVINNTFILQQPTSKTEFNDFIAPLIALKDKKAVFEKWADHNQRYILLANQEKNAHPIYEYYDAEKHKNALYHYNSAVNYYMQITHEKDNVILMGIWDGDLMKLNPPPNSELEKEAIEVTSDLNLLTTWSIKIGSKKLKIQSFDLLDLLLTINAENNTFHLITDIRTNTSSSVKVDFPLTGHYFHDFYYNNVYMIAKENEETIVYKLNVKEGSRQKINTIGKEFHPRNIKIINDKVFFTLLDENQFVRLLQLKL